MTAMEPISAQRDAVHLMLSKNKQNTKWKYVPVSPGCKRTWRAVVAIQVMGDPLSN